MVLEVLERTLASDQGLDEEPEAGEHGQSATRGKSFIISSLSRTSQVCQHSSRAHK